ncbi:MAG: hypothetical protein LBF84_02340 [Holosporales bacterium]|jgi:hypothetical protein|nr:hypothetical protein [Holosporales bacterium]
MFGFKKFLAGIAFCAACALTPSFASEAPVADATDAVYSIACRVDGKSAIVELVSESLKVLAKFPGNEEGAEALAAYLDEIGVNKGNIDFAAFKIIFGILIKFAAPDKNILFLPQGW